MGQQADTALFDEVYAAHRLALHAYFLGRTGDAEVAADLLQEVFLRAWRNLDAMLEVPAGQLRYWLFAIGRNLLTDHYRRSAIRAQGEEAWGDEGPPASMTPSPEAQVEQMEQLRRLDEAIRQLPSKMRTVLVMQVVGEMNSAEIGAALDMPAGTVRYYLSQARKRLVGRLFPQADSLPESAC
jgi:RNA polymerase sigma-70 factor (ECF subfamily)